MRKKRRKTRRTKRKKEDRKDVVMMVPFIYGWVSTNTRRFICRIEVRVYGKTEVRHVMYG